MSSVEQLLRAALSNEVSDEEYKKLVKEFQSTNHEELDKVLRITAAYRSQVYADLIVERKHVELDGERDIIPKQEITRESKKI